MHAQTNTLPRVAYSIDETAAMLGISRWSTYQLIKRGDLRPVRIGARQRVPAEQLERLVRPAECAA
ncbi:MAG: helix-turn-helix domain-containing protein [Steroidobacteraceae bacterium]